MKIAKSHFGGCKGYKKPTVLQGKKCLIEPTTTDNLCFWQCLAIALHKEQIPSISKPHTLAQTEKAQKLRQMFYDSIKTPENERPELVMLYQIPAITKELHLDIEIYTLREETINNKKQLIQICLWSMPEKHDDRILIHLHYDDWCLIKGQVSNWKLKGK